MQRTKLLTSGLVVLAVLGSTLPSGATTPDELILQQIAGYRSWNRVTPEILKLIPKGSAIDRSVAG
jgi:hypothetical protein